MFGTNEIVGRKFFKDHGDRLMVTSVFHTLQGEGPFAGRPAVFVRLAKCNLACAFCDTYFDHGEWMGRDELHQAMITAIQGPGPLDLSKMPLFRDKVLVITGGEPLLQGEALHPFIVTCGSFFDAVQIESNGLFRSRLPHGTVLVVSPKCVDRSTGHAYLKPHEETLARANCLKFVMSASADSPYHAVPQWAFDWHKEFQRPIYVSPMNMYRRQPEMAWCKVCGGSGFVGPETGYDGVCSECGGQQRTHDLAERSMSERVSFWEPGLLDLAQVQANHEHAAAYALKHGFYLSIQMQLFASIP